MKTMSLPMKIRKVREQLHYWQLVRGNGSPIHYDRFQNEADREALRLAGVLDGLEAQQRDQEQRIERAKKGRNED